jgi:hypothetical protein
MLRPSYPYYSKPISFIAGDDYHFNGWDLIGNPFVCNAYLVDEEGDALPYYRMNAAGKGFEAVASGVIAPTEGIFYKAVINGYVYFTRNAPAKKGYFLTMSVNQGSNVIDNAVIRFDGGNNLKKFDFNGEGSKLYIPQDGKAYAVVDADKVGEMPICFKTEADGEYTLGFSIEGVDFSYLHLVDNLTGNDVDLLTVSSYMFEARDSDDASRFTIVYKVK